MRGRRDCEEDPCTFARCSTQKINVNGALTDSTWKWIKSQCPAAVTDIADDTPSCACPSL